MHCVKFILPLFLAGPVYSVQPSATSLDSLPSVDEPYFKGDKENTTALFFSVDDVPYPLTSGSTVCICLELFKFQALTPTITSALNDLYCTPRAAKGGLSHDYVLASTLSQMK